jgi:serine/threonine-protein kinase
MTESTADRNLLFGLLALGSGLIDAETLRESLHSWTSDRSKGLDQVLVDEGALREDQRGVVGTLVDFHLDANGGDVGQTISVLGTSGGPGSVFLERLDPDLTASLGLSGSANGDAPTRSAVVGLASAAEGRALAAPEGRFQLLRYHARGGLGEVFVALDRELNREVALKQIQARHADNPASRARFVIEAEVTGGLEHPGVVPVYSLGADGDGRPFYAMRFIRGETLKEAIGRFHDAGRSDGQDAPVRELEFRRLLGRLIDACNAVAFAHSRGILHRDLKPANIMLGPYGETLVVDWGLAKRLGKPGQGGGEGGPDEAPGWSSLIPSASGSEATEAGSIVGTPAYMSPEQAEGDLARIGPESDVYSLGATLYTILAGRPAFETESVPGMLAKVREGAFPPPRAVAPKTPPALEAICLKAMSRDPSGRYPTALALAADLENWLGDQPVSAHREPWMARLARWARRHRTAVAAAVALLTTAVVALAVSTVLIGRERDNAERHRVVAETNFRQARRAIDDTLTRVSESRLLKVDGMQPLRRELLRDALGYYQEFLEDHASDPSLRADLAAAYLRVADVTAQIGSKEDALAAARQAAALAEPLRPSGPDPAPQRDTRARALTMAALLHRDLGAIEQGIATLRQVHALRREDLGSRPGDVEAALDLAEAMRTLAGLLNTTGRRDEALSLLQEALDDLGPLARAHPDAVEIRATRAEIEDDRVTALTEDGQAEEALREALRALEIWAQLVREAPDRDDFKEYQANSYRGLAEAQRRLHRVDEAIRSLESSIAVTADLARRHPAVTEYAMTWAYALINVGSLRGMSGDLPGSTRAFEEAREQLARLAAINPAEVQVQASLARALTNLSVNYQMSGRVPEAIEQLEKARDILARLSDSNPTVVDLQVSLSRAHHNLGVAYGQLDRHADALAAFHASREIRERLVAGTPNDMLLRSSLAASTAGVAAALDRLGRPAEAVPLFRRAIEQERVAMTKSPAQAPFRVRLRQHYGTLGRSLRALGRSAEAAEAALARRDLSAGDPVALHDAARDLALAAGTPPAAGESADPNLHAELAMEALRESVAAGFSDGPGLASDPGFAPLSTRDDFRRLVLDLLDRAFPAHPFAGSDPTPTSDRR